MRGAPPEHGKQSRLCGAPSDDMTRDSISSGKSSCISSVELDEVSTFFRFFFMFEHGAFKWWLRQHFFELVSEVQVLLNCKQVSRKCRSGRKYSRI